MKKFYKTLFSLIVLFLLLPTISYAGQFKVIRVSDGDTIIAFGHDIVIRVKLIGIDAPEMAYAKRIPGQPYSEQARAYLAELILNKIVDIKGYGLDDSGRVFGVININGKNINLEMIKAGLAEVSHGRLPRKFKVAPYRNAEREAKIAGTGMWTQADKYIRPE